MSSVTRDPRRHLPLILAALSMIGPFSIDAIFPGFPDIGHAFGVGEVALQQLLSVYLLAYAVMSLFLSLIHISEPTRPSHISRMPSSA